MRMCTVVVFAISAGLASSIGGIVDDNMGYEMRGALVTLVDQRNPKFTRTTKTNARGEFLFKNLQPGEYLVTAYFRGYASAHAKVQLGVDENAYLRKNILMLTYADISNSLF